MNDQEHNLIQAARNGDQAAFGELVQQYQKRVFALAVRMCPTPELAEEAAQEAFLAAWQGLPFPGRFRLCHMALPADLQRLRGSSAEGKPPSGTVPGR